MSSQHVDSVRKFLSFFKASAFGALPQIEPSLLSPNVEYDWFVAQDPPIRRSLIGRADVESYLSILHRTYQIIDADEPSLCVTGNKVVVLGGERARLLRTGQTVRTDWTAVFEFDGDQITRIAFTIYSWSVLEAGPTQKLSDCSAAAVAVGNRTRFVLPLSSSKSFALTAS